MITKTNPDLGHRPGRQRMAACEHIYRALLLNNSVTRNLREPNYA